MDRNGLRPAAAARATAGVAIPLIAGVAAGQPAAGATAAFGALSVGVAVLTAGPRTPSATMLAASVGMGTATLVGSVSGLVPPVHLAVLAGAGFLAGLLVAAGRGATQVGVNAVIALLVFGRNPAGLGPAALHACWVLAGGLLQTGLAAALRSPAPLRAQREALAAGYEALAQGAAQAPSPGVAEAAVTAREAIGLLLRTGDRSEAEPLLGLADQLDRIRAEFHALHFLPPELSAGPGGRQPELSAEPGGGQSELSAGPGGQQAVTQAFDLAGPALARAATALRLRRGDRDRAGREPPARTGR